jgi:hypothetical protein
MCPFISAGMTLEPATPHHGTPGGSRADPGRRDVVEGVEGVGVLRNEVRAE